MNTISARFLPEEAAHIQLAAIKAEMTPEEFIRWAAIVHAAEGLGRADEVKPIDDPWGTGQDSARKG